MIREAPEAKVARMVKAAREAKEVKEVKAAREAKEVKAARVRPAVLPPLSQPRSLSIPAI